MTGTPQTEAGSADDETIGIQLLQATDEGLKLSFSDHAVSVVETTCRARANWTAENGYVEESYLIEDLTVFLTSDEPVSLSPVEVARLTDAAAWVAATRTGGLADDASDVETALWGIVASSVEDDQ